MGDMLRQIVAPLNEQRFSEDPFIRVGHEQLWAMLHAPLGAPVARTPGRPCCTQAHCMHLQPLDSTKHAALLCS